MLYFSFSSKCQQFWCPISGIAHKCWLWFLIERSCVNFSPTRSHAILWSVWYCSIRHVKFHFSEYRVEQCWELLGIFTRNNLGHNPIMVCREYAKGFPFVGLSDVFDRSINSNTTNQSQESICKRCLASGRIDCMVDNWSVSHWNICNYLSILLHLSIRVSIVCFSRNEQ